MKYNTYRLKFFLILSYLSSGICNASGECPESLFNHPDQVAQVCNAPRECPIGQDPYRRFLEVGRTQVAILMDEWVEPKKVISLDTATCNTNLRPLWLALKSDIPFKRVLMLRSGVSDAQSFFVQQRRDANSVGNLVSGTKQSFRRGENPTFRDNPEVTPEALEGIAKSYPRITELGLISIKGVNGMSLAACNFNYLTDLLVNDVDLSEKDFSTIITRYKMLSKVSLMKSIKNISQDTFLGQKMEQLKILSITIGDTVDLEAIAKFCPAIEKLELVSFTDITGDNLPSDSFVNLKALQLANIKTKMTDKVISTVLTPRLTVLRLINIKGITLDQLPSNSPDQLKELDIRNSLKLGYVERLQLINCFPNLTRIRFDSLNNQGGQIEITEKIKKELFPREIEINGKMTFFNPA